jgi:hypothetical protein
MVIHMKTTLMIDDGVMQRLKEEAARRRTTISDLVEASLRAMLDQRPQGAENDVEPLPAFDLGTARVDISDRDALYQAMEGR